MGRVGPQKAGRVDPGANTPRVEGQHAPGEGRTFVGQIFVGPYISLDTPGGDGRGANTPPTGSTRPIGGATCWSPLEDILFCQFSKSSLVSCR